MQKIILSLCALLFVACGDAPVLELSVGIDPALQASPDQVKLNISDLGSQILLVEDKLLPEKADGPLTFPVTVEIKLRKTIPGVPVSVTAEGLTAGGIVARARVNIDALSLKQTVVLTLTAPGCGDGVIDPNEACDDGAQNNNAGPCLPSCQIAGCGDGILQQALNEECDDGNQIPNDGCEPDCTATAPTCGDGKLDDNEECDNGNLNSDLNPDACRTNCRLSSCGDSVIDAGEQCDDGPANALTGACLLDCNAASCGDGILQTSQGESCDDANAVEGDGCDALCHIEPPPSCGDGNIDNGEQCDDGVNNSDTAIDACRTNCHLASCGDGIIDTAEACDDANANSLAGPCLLDCTAASCGDGIVQNLLLEECDDANTQPGDGCDALCQIEPPPGCGDGLVVAPEQCDNGVNNSNSLANACRTNCRFATCGDGALDSGELCDDAGANGLAGPCLPDCTPAFCGDGVFQPNRFEACDDGNNIAGDGCFQCLLENPPDCGDGNIVAPEFCDNGPANSNVTADACRTNCVPARCGDAVIDSGEQCDNGGTNSLAGPCLQTCQLARCGDGIRQQNRGEGCDDGNTINGDGCSSLCAVEVVGCGDGTVIAPEQCDDGALNANTPNNCRVNCALPRCGDDIVDNNEACDDGVNNNLLGPCLLDCTLPRCGDGIFQPNLGETCDDNNNTAGDGCSPVCQVEAPPGCGDGLVNTPGEQCDSGASNSNTTPNACRSTCTLPRCGDGVADNGELCDNGSGNTFSGPCLPTCQLAGCGDGVFQTNRGETCDDGNTQSGDGCSGSCLIEPPASCGDGVIGVNETCDNGVNNSNTNPNACRLNCTLPRCGDGAVDTGEVCDDGGANALLGPCLPTCQLARCGDFILQPNLGEVCDDGNTNSNDGCSSTCLLESPPGCGDGTKQSNEQCDNGPANSNTAPDACRTNCTNPRCGDGATDTNEECDNGGANSLAGPCLQTCELAHCGDGVRQINLGEGCDDGNNVDFDGCSAICTVEAPPNCADGVLQANQGEQCDDGNLISGDGCDNVCRRERCGDGVIQSTLGEQCDDGNIALGDGCGTNCRVEFCGDGVVQPILGESCEDGNTFVGDGCDNLCRTEVCGNGRIDFGEACDDGGTSLNDGCDDFCQTEFSFFCAQIVPAQATNIGSTLGGSNNFNASCTGFGAQERLFSFTPGVIGQTGTLHITLHSDTDQGVYILGDCNDPFSELACVDIELGGTDEILDFAVDGGTPLTIVVDGFTPTEVGDFILTVNYQVDICGDGIVSGSELCDDGNTTLGDGCDSCELERCGDGIQQDLAPITSVDLDWLIDGCGATPELVLSLNGQEAFRALADSDSFCECLPGVTSFTSTDPTFLSLLQNGVNTASFSFPRGGAVVSWIKMTIHRGAEEQAEVLFDAPGGFPDDAIVEDPDRCFAGAFFQSSISGIDIVSSNDEECDDGNNISGDGCESNCVIPSCGNARVESASEECDDGNNINFDGCNSTCEDENCGDGTIQPTQIALGLEFVYVATGCFASGPITFSINNQVAAVAPSDPNCTCSPGVSSFVVTDPTVLDLLQNGPNVFTVDFPQGALSDADLAWALALVQTTNGIQEIVIFDQSGGNDALNRNGDLCGANFQTNGPAQSVTRDVLGLVEECDDNNNTDGDGCSAFCDIELCGDGDLDIGEECDDNNTVSNDGCDASCIIEFCGDGILHPGELCDDGNNTPQDGCGATCQLEICGNGVIDFNEECDDGNLANGDGCDSICFSENYFNVTSLTTDSCSTFEHGFLTGDDRGALALAPGRVVYTGDTRTTSFNNDNLPNNLNWSTRRDALFSDLEDNTLYSLSNNATPLTNTGGVANAIIRINPLNGNTVGAFIPLSQSITIANVGQTGVFSGRTRLVLHTGGQAFDIQLPSGQVTTLGPSLPLSHTGCEIGTYYFGVAEFFAGEVFVDYVGNFNNRILRTRLSDNTTTTLTQLSNLGDMCAFSVSRLDGRWYFHHEFSSQFRSGGDETIGFCEARIDAALCGDGTIQPQLGEECDDGNILSTDGCSSSCRDELCGNNRLDFGEACDDGNSTNGDGCNSFCVAEFCGDSLLNNNGEACDDGNFVGGDSCGPTCQLEICGSGFADVGEGCDDGNQIPGDGCDANCQPETFFQIGQLTTNNCAVAEHGTITGDDRGALVLAGGNVIYSGDSASVSFDQDNFTETNVWVALRDVLASDLATSKVYSFGVGLAPLSSASNQTATTLLELDPLTGNVINAPIFLSSPVPFSANNGIFSGRSRIVIHNGTNAFDILIPSGQVTNLGAVPALTHFNCELTAFYFGVVEFVNNQLFVSYVRNATTISRTRLPDGLTTTLASFTNLGEMCAFTISPASNRWFFHHEANSQFRSGGDETIGSCDVGLAPLGCGDGVVTAPEECDDHNNITGDGCSVICQREICGNGRIDIGDACDDGNLTNGDGCNASCVVELCGDTIVNNSTEQCDDANTINGDGCDNNCKFTDCGNGIVTSPEQCDDGNVISGDGCSAGCLVDQHLEIGSLTGDSCTVIEHEAITGDDRSAFVLSKDRALYSGDTRTASFLKSNLSSSANFGAIRDALFSDLASGKVYTLANAATPLASTGGTATTLIELDPVTGAVLGSPIALSQSIVIASNGQTGVFSGMGRLLLLTGGKLFDIALPSGQVVDRGAMANPTHASCELLTFYYGVAEFFSNQLFVTYVKSTTEIARTRVPDGLTTTVSVFSNLGEMCAFSVSPIENKWYFHEEADSQFRSGTVAGTNESLGFCNATYTTSLCTDGVLDAGEQCDDGNFINGDGCNFDCQTEICGNGRLDTGEQCEDGNTVNNDGCSSICVIEFCGDGSTNNIIETCDDGNAVVGDGCGLTCIIEACGNNLLDPGEQCDDGNFVNGDGCSSTCVTETSLQFTSFTAENCSVIDTNATTGDDNSAIAVTRDRVLYSGDTRTVSFNKSLGDPLNFAGASRTAMFSDLATGRLYSLSNGATLLGTTGGTANAFIEIDPLTGNTIGNPISMTTSVTIANAGQVGVFSGMGRLILLSGGTAFDILLHNGQVTNLGAMANPTHIACDITTYYFGIAESFGGRLFVDYIKDANTVSRTRVPDGLTSTLGVFSNLGDMCAISFSQTNNTWHFHIEGVSQFDAAGVETQGFCDVKRVSPLCGNGAVNAGEECDDGNLVNGDTCSSTCQNIICGNNRIDAGEQCDDGNAISGDGCAACVAETGLQINQLTTNDCQTVDTTANTGDDRDAIAISTDRLLYTGDTRTISSNAQNLTQSVNTGFILDALLSDLATGKVYSLANNGNPLTSTGGTANSIIEIDPITGFTTSNVLPLSTSITIGVAAANRNGLFSGRGRGIVHTGSSTAGALGATFSIRFSDGQVTNLGSTPTPTHLPCDVTAYYFGVVEEFGGQTFLTNVRTATNISRTRVTDGQVTTVGTFSNLADACAMTVSPRLNRWFFHLEGTSQFNFVDQEISGACNASFISGLCGNNTINSGEECDDANTANNDGCSAACLLETCGNGRTDANEECDDANTNDTDGCRNNCTFSCGSGIAAAARSFDVPSQHCYLRLAGPLSWDNARTDCGTKGGHLVSIASDRENDIVQSLAGASAVWIGLNDQTTEGTFVWVPEGASPSEPITYTNFNTAEPNGGAAIDCVQMLASNVAWNDIACSTTTPYICELEAQVCGNGFIEPNEQCDDGNTTNGDGCNSSCTVERCGDTATTTGGRLASLDFVWLASATALAQNITFKINGTNALVTVGESGSGSCTPGIHTVTITNPDILELVKNGNNTFTVDFSGAAGNQLSWALATLRYNGGATRDITIFDAFGGLDAETRDTDHCNNGRFNNQPAQSITAFVSITEACDDGNTTAGDGCRSDCLAIETCGNGLTDGVEQCDDGNNISGDGCSAACITERCNDSIINNSTEQCDDGNTTGGDGCGPTCKLEICGSGILEAPEQCDDGNTVGGDGCAAGCRTDQNLKIESLTANNCTIVEHEFATGDDRSAFAVSTDRVLYTGDTRTSSFSKTNLESISNFGAIRDALFSDLSTGKVYTLANAATPLASTGGTATTIIELNATTGAVIGSPIALSQSIVIASNGQTGVFSGMGRLLLLTGGKLFDIALPSGQVVDKGAMANPTHASCELATFYFGVAEFFSNQLFVTYVKSTTEIARTRVPDGLTTTVSTFTNLGEMCAFSVSPIENKWYFHEEADSQFRAGTVAGVNETLGFCSATYTKTQCTNGVVDAGEECDDGNFAVGDGCNFDCQTEICGNGRLDANEQCEDSNTANNDGCSSTCVIEFCGDGSTNNIVETCDDGNTLAGDGCGPTCLVEFCGNGFVDLDEQCDDGNTVGNDGCSAGCLLDQHLQIGSLTGNSCTVIEHEAITGDDRSAFAISTDRILYTGDTRTASFSKSNLSSSSNFAAIRDALFSDLMFGKVYTLANGATPLASTGGTVTTIIELNATTGAVIGSPITLSQSLVIANNGQTGVFSSMGRLLLLTGGRLFDISTLTGQVVDLGPMANPAHASCELATYYYGVGEFFGGNFFVTYVKSTTEIARTRVPDGLTTTVSTFTNLGEMCAFSVSPIENKWYFHEEADSQFRSGTVAGTNESLGFCNATYTTSLCTDGVLDAGEQCDDGNFAVGDGCNFDCQIEICGNGRVDFGEQCDDGNTVSNDSCSSLCVIEFCGDSVTNNAVESCDDGNTTAGDGCGPTCETEVCGTGFVDAGEECDDGNLTSGDGCDIHCEIEDQFSIGALTAQGCTVVETNTTTGDDRDALVVSGDRVLYTGDSRTVSFDADTFASTNTTVIRDALLSDLSTGKLYTLSNGATPLTSTGGTANAIIELNPNTALATGSPISLSQPIAISNGGQTGIFSGRSRVIIHAAGAVFDVRLPSGQVTNLGAMSALPHVSCEATTYYFGIAEFTNDQLFVVYVKDATTISRTRIPDGLTTVAGLFSNLGEMCAIAASPKRNKWFFHHEFTSQFKSGDETSGSCNATVTPLRCGDGVLDAAFREECDDANNISTDGCSSRCELEVCGNGRIDAGEECDDGNTTNGDGCDATCFSENLLEIESLSANNCITQEHAGATGDDRSALAVGSTRVLYTGDTRTASFSQDQLLPIISVSQLDALSSDLNTGKIYSLGVGGNPYPAFSSQPVTSLLEINEQTGAIVGSPINLSVPIPMPTFDVGLFAGRSSLLLHNAARAFLIKIPSGQVVDLGPMPSINHQFCENSQFYYGIAEFFGGTHFLTYVRNSTTISRTRVPDGLTTTVSTFSNLSDMCAIGINKNTDRWFFHHEFTSQFASGDETIGSCDASFVAPLCGDGEIQPTLNEECDDTNLISGDGCSPKCELEICGNGRIDTGEECDDTNTTNGDGCDSVCVIELCGDALINNGEDCEDGNTVGGDGCGPTCKFEVCGSGFIDPNEECDDGNTTNGDGCNNSCISEDILHISSLTTNECTSIEHGNITGFSEGGIALSTDRVLFAGGDVASFDKDLKTNPFALGQFYDAIFSDLRSKKIYTLATGNVPLPFGGGTVNSIIELDPISGEFVGAPLALSSSFVLNDNSDDVGFFAGEGRLLLHNGLHLFEILLPSGQVNDLGPTFSLSHTFCGGWAYWGVAEFFQGELFLTYPDDNAGIILRTSVATGLSETLIDLGANEGPSTFICAISVSPEDRRWYFQYSGTGFLRSGDETLGFCNAEFASSLCGNGTLNANLSETCDDGNNLDGDGCNAHCQLESCGNQFIDFNETCDDPTDEGCSNTCNVEFCGDGITQPQGPVQSLTFSWLASRQFQETRSILFHINGVLAAQADLIDNNSCFPGVRSVTLTDPLLLSLLRTGQNNFSVSLPNGGSLGWALATIRTNLSRDVVIFDAPSTFDDDALRRDPALCSVGSVQDPAPITSSSLLILNEQCDDNNFVLGDGCSATCQLEACGNGNIDPGEQCDDANLLDLDGCSAACLVELSPLPYTESFDDNVANGFLFEGDGSASKWQIDTQRSVSPTRALYFGNTATRTYQNGTSRVTGSALTPFFTVSATGGSLQMRRFQATEGGAFFDELTVEAVSPTGASLATLQGFTQNTAGFVLETVAIPASLQGQTIRLRLRFDTKDGFNNSFEGVYLDDLVINP